MMWLSPPGTMPSWQLKISKGHLQAGARQWILFARGTAKMYERGSFSYSL